MTVNLLARTGTTCQRQEANDSRHSSTASIEVRHEYLLTLATRFSERNYSCTNTMRTNPPLPESRLPASAFPRSARISTSQQSRTFSMLPWLDAGSKTQPILLNLVLLPIVRDWSLKSSRAISLDIASRS